MKNPQPFFSHQGGNGALNPVVAPGGTAQFDLKMPTRLGQLWPYLQALVAKITLTITQPQSGGSIIYPDELYRIVASFFLQSEDLGTIYAKSDTPGPFMGYLAQVIANNYKYPFRLRAPIPATGGTYAIEIPFRVPLGMRTFLKGHQVAPWTGFFTDGRFEVQIAAANCLDSVSTGATIGNATVTVWGEIAPEPECRIHSMWKFNRYEIAGGTTQHNIKGIGGGAGLNGCKQGARVPFMAYLSNLLGLGGNGAMDNILQIELPGRGQEAIQIPEVFPIAFDGLREVDTMSIATGPTWPYQIAAGPQAVALSASLAFLPYWFPGMEAEITKMQKWFGNMRINQLYTATPTSAAVFATLEGYEYEEAYKDTLVARMGQDPTAKRGRKLASKQNTITASKAVALPEKLDV
jgi:hypothetical protein